MLYEVITKPSEARDNEAGKIAATRQRELDAAISAITKTYGEGSIMRLGDARAQTRITSYNVCYTKLLRAVHRPPGCENSIGRMKRVWRVCWKKVV